MKVTIPLVAATFFIFCGHGRADETEGVQLTSGDWALVTHQPSEVAPPDICVASNDPGHFALRADQTSISVRVDDPDWSLPSSVQGTVSIEVAGSVFPLEIDYNTDTMVDAAIPTSSLQGLLDGMAKGAVMKVSAGKSEWLVSLTGSQKVINAFRTCAHLEGSAPGAGTNPFQ